LARGTWQRYASGWRAFDQFQARAGTDFTWPLGPNVMQAFAAYCLVEKQLKPSSVKTYISSIVKLHKIKGFHAYESKDKTTESFLRGAANLLMAAPQLKPPTRRVMTLPLLKHLGHRLAGSGWAEDTQQVIWSACLVGFFGTARMGELLAPHELHLDPTATLTWSCTQYRHASNSFLIHIRLPKISTPEGDFLDLFPYPEPQLCPVAALKRLHGIQAGAGRAQPRHPVFAYTSGKNLTRHGLNSALKVLLADVCDDNNTISCHSFRAGLPSVMAEHPEEMSAEDIRHWGRWSSNSNSYQAYTRLKTNQKQKLYGKIVNALSVDK
jgi:hypothetical protein